MWALTLNINSFGLGIVAFNDGKEFDRSDYVKLHQTFTLSGKQKEDKSFIRIISFFAGGYLNSNCIFAKWYQTISYKEPIDP